MLRKLAAGTGAAVVAAGLAAGPAVAARLPTMPDADASGGHPQTSGLCGDMAQSQQNGVEGVGPAGFVFGPFADVPHLLSADRTCAPATMASAGGAVPPVPVAAPPADGSVPPLPDLSAAHRHESAPPATGHPVPPGSDSGNPGPPGVPPPDTPEAPGAPGAPESPSAPEGPGAPPGDTLPPLSGAVPPPITPQGPLDDTPMVSPPPASAGPTSSPEELVGSAETGTSPPRAAAEAPPGLPQTGRDTRPLAAAGGFNLLAAGLAVIAGARRSRKRRGDQPGAN